MGNRDSLLSQVIEYIYRVKMAVELAAAIGIRQVISIQTAKTQDIKVRIPGYAHPLYVRPGTSDMQVLYDVFVRDEYRGAEMEGGGLILDLGGNVGYTAVYLAHKYPGARIVSVEPESSNYTQLIKNCRPYSRIRTYHAAVWYEKTMLDIADTSSEKWAFTVKQASGKASGTHINTVTVPEILADEKMTKVKIAKIDIEGAEYELFRHHAVPWLKKTDTVIMETHDRFRPGAARAVRSALKKAGHIIMQEDEEVLLSRRNGAR